MSGIAPTEAEVDVRFYQTFAIQLGLEVDTNNLLREWYLHQVGHEPEVPMPFTDGVTAADTSTHVQASDDIKAKLYDKAQCLWHIQVERNRLERDGFKLRFGYEPRTPLPYTEAGVSGDVDSRDAAPLLIGVYEALGASWYLQIEKNRLAREAFKVQFDSEPNSAMPYTDNGVIDEDTPSTGPDPVPDLHNAIGLRLGMLVRLHDEWGALFMEAFNLQNGAQLPHLTT